MIYQVPFLESQEKWQISLEENNIQAPFLTWQWHNIWFQTLGKEYTPLTFIINDKIVASFAKKNDVLVFAGGDEIADYLDIIGIDEHKQSAWEELILHCKTLGITQFSLRNVPENSSTRTFFESISPSSTVQEDTTPLFQPPSSWEIYTESLGKKYTHELERKLRKFDREHPDSQIIESQNPSDDLPILFQLMEKDEAKKTFLSPEMKYFFTQITNKFASQISLRYITLGDKKIAATLSFIMDSTYYLYNSGFDKECCSIAGFFLKAMNIKHAIEKLAKTYNFLQGNERYKYELGGKDFGVYKIDYQY